MPMAATAISGAWPPRGRYFRSPGPAFCPEHGTGNCGVHPHIHNPELISEMCRQGGGPCLAPGEIDRLCKGHTLGRGRHALCHNAVVRTEDDQPPLVQPIFHSARDPRHLNRDILQPPQAPRAAWPTGPAGPVPPPSPPRPAAGSPPAFPSVPSLSCRTPHVKNPWSNSQVTEAAALWFSMV